MSVKTMFGQGGFVARALSAGWRLIAALVDALHANAL